MTTTETSNARGETYTFDMIEEAWGDAVPLTKPYFDRFRARLETLRQLAAPPPAAARGDVRGTRRPSDAAIAAAFWEHRARENSIPSELCDVKLVQFGHEIVSRARVLEPSLAAEGVQAGEVEQRARELLAAEYQKRGHGRESAEARASYIERHECAAFDAIASTLSQQPEARGVVGELVQMGDDEDGHPRLIINTTREAIKASNLVPFSQVEVRNG